MSRRIEMLKRIYTKACRKLLLHDLQENEEPVFMAQNPRYAAYQVGEWSYGNPAVLADVDGPILRLGRFCSIAEGVVIMLGGNHRIDWATTYPFNVLFEDAKGVLGHPNSKGDVIIGHDVWIGRESLILSGVTIGNGAVIAARAVVTKDIAPYSVVGGNPARHIKYRFPEHIIERLQQIAWWDWPLPEIKKAWPFLLNSDIEAFIASYTKQDSRSDLPLATLTARPF